MDFRTASCITERMKKDVELGIFGYTEHKEDYFMAVANWYQTYFDWKVEKEWLVKTPGVVFAIAMAIQALTKEGDGVLIQQPVYYPFSKIVTCQKSQAQLRANQAKALHGVRHSFPRKPAQLPQSEQYPR